MVEYRKMKAILIGAGFTGVQLAKELVAVSADVVLMDTDADRVRHASDHLDCTVIKADGRDLRALERAGLASADAVIALTADDEVNMVICSLVDSVYPWLSKIARVRNYAYYLSSGEARERAKVERPDARPLYGIDVMLNPDVEAAGAIASAVEHGAVGSVIELGGGFGIVTLSVGEGSVLDGLQLKEISRLEGWSYLVSFVDSNGEMSLPNGETRVKKGDFIGIVTPEDSIDNLLQFTKTPQADIRRIVIFGADRVSSLLLSRRMARQAQSSWLSLLGLRKTANDVDIVVVDRDPELCRQTVERFPNVRVLCGDVTDENLLSEEKLFSSDLLVAASGNYELNLVTAAYMKSKGVKKTVALTANSAYGFIASKLGVDVAVPMRGSVVDAIMGHLRGGNVRGVHTVCNRRFEIIEGEVHPKAYVAGKTLAELTRKGLSGSLVLLHRAPGEESWSVPGGSTVITPGSSIVLISECGDLTVQARFFGKV